MARWRLRTGHYLNTIIQEDDKIVAGAQWEYKEQDRGTGKAARKMYNVPQLLDPNDPADCNYPGEIIVANDFDRAFPKDIVFKGEPTPDMEPLDDAAEALSNSLRHKWEHPIETLPVNGGMSSDEQAFMAKMMQSFASVQQAAPAPNAGVSVEEFEALKKQLAEMKALLEQKPASTIQRRA